MDISVADRPAERRYDVTVDGAPAGFAAYVLTDGVITFTHTEIDPSFEGHGVGSALARAALDDVRARGLRVVALCPFVKGWIRRHPEYADLLDRP